MSTQCKDTHLNSALSVTRLKESIRHLRDPSLQYRNNQVENTTAKLKHFLDGLGLDPCITFNHVPQELMKFFFDLVPLALVSHAVTRQYQQYFKSLREIVPGHLTKLLNGYSLEDHQRILKKFSSQIDKKLIQLYALRNFWENGVCLTAKPLQFQGGDSTAIITNWDKWMIQPDGSFGYIGKIMGEDESILMTIYLTGDFMAFRANGQIYLSTRNHFLMMSDIFSQRFICVWTSELALLYNRSNYLRSETLYDMWSIGDKLLEKFGNLSYNSICLWEALVIAEVLSRKEDEAVDHEAFKREIQTTFINSQGESFIEYLGEVLTKEINPFLQGIPLTQIFQAFGLYRLWGHPNIDEIQGVRKLKSVACAPRALNSDMIQFVQLKWREFFCMNYYAKHRRWPNISKCPGAPSSMLLTHILDGLEVSITHPLYNLKDWAYIKFEKTFEVAEKFELSEVISDKAISLSIDDLKRSCMTKGHIGESHFRNVILNWLNTDLNNPKEFLDRINLEGFPPQEKCVGLHPKERELKIFARLFGLLTLEKRLYVVVTEAMLADQIFPYFPEITMVFDSVTLQTKIHKNTQKQARTTNRKEFHSVVVNMDFNKWNSYMREEETLPIFQDFDHLFGYEKVYTRTHEMFKDSMMYLADGTITPFDRSGKEILSEGIWRGHLGGIEGLRQKGWTIFTVVLLKYISEKMRIKCQIMGQGDNQVLIIDYPIHDKRSIRERHTEFMETLNTMLSTIGPPLKLEETWSSSHFFIYGKYPVHEGKPMSMSMKKICRTMRLTNEGFQNLESTCSSITANASAASSSDHDPTIPYIVGTFETIGAIDLHLRHPFYQYEAYEFSRQSTFRVPRNGVSIVHKLMLREDDEKNLRKLHYSVLVNIALLPCILGGFPTLQLCDLMNHGFPDPLSLNIYSLLHFWKTIPKSNLRLRRAIYSFLHPIYNPDINPEMLCQDPVSINLLHSSSGSDKLKRLVFEFMTEKMPVKNKHFLNFLSLAKQRQQELSNALSTMHPFNPRIAHSILESSIVGRAMKVVSKVNKTNTIIGLMIKTRNQERRREMGEEATGLGDEVGDLRWNPSIATLYGKFDKNHIVSVLHAIYKNHSNDSELNITCSVVHADKLRTESWGREITGVTLAVPQEFLSWHSADGSGCDNLQHPYPEIGYLLVRSSLRPGETQQEDFNPLELKLGPHKPFFGSKTKNKVKHEGGVLKKRAPLILRGALDLLMLINWGTAPNSELAGLIKTIFSSFTDLDPEGCIPDPSMVSGSVEHRWQDTGTSHSTTLSILYELLTHMTVSTNLFCPELIPDRGITDNCNISYQSVLTWIGCIFASKLLNDPFYLKNTYHLHLNCPTCIKPVNEELLEIDPCPLLVDKIRMETDTTNPYCWIPKEVLVKSQQHVEEFPRIIQLSPSSKHLSHAFYQISADYYLHEYAKELSHSYYSFDPWEGNSVIPINVAFQIDIYSLFKELIFRRVCYFIYSRSPELSRGRNISVQEIFREGIMYLIDSPLAWFKGMESLKLNYKGLITFQNHHPSLTLPKGSPPTTQEICVFFKAAFSTQSQAYTLGDFIKQLQETLNSPILITTRLTYNPLIINLLLHSFSSSHILNNPYIMVLAALRSIFSKSMRDFDLKSSSQLLPTFKREILESPIKIYWSNLSTMMDKASQTMEFFKGTIDSTSKLVSTRMKIRQVSSPTQQGLIPSVIILSNLPKSHEVYLHRADYHSLETSHEIPLTPLKMELMEVNYINHRYKVALPVTTAGYKLLSVFKGIEDLLTLYVTPFTERKVCCLGDGAGGYTTVCGRIFPQHKLFFNTFFDLTKVSSVGVDNFIPAAIGMFPETLNKTEGIELVTEGISDLTDPKIVPLLSNSIKDAAIIICDAEGGGWKQLEKPLKILQTLLQIAENTLCELVVIKSYAQRIDLLYLLINMGLSCFHQFKAIRSYFSTSGNTEIFLVFWERREHPFYSLPSCHPSNDPTLIRGRIPSTHPRIWSYEDFIKLMNQSSIFQKTASHLAESYSLSLNIPIWMNDVLNDLSNWLINLADSSKRLNWPSSLIYVWRREFNLVKFSSLNISRNRPNFIDPKVINKILQDYFLTLCLIYPKDYHLKLIQEAMGKGYLIMYASIDGSWALNYYNKIPKNIRNMKIINLSEKLTKNMITKIFVSVGRLLSLPSLPIQFRHPKINLHAPTIKTCASHPSFWPLMKEELMPLGMTPIIHHRDNKNKWIEEPIPITLKVMTSTQFYKDLLDMAEAGEFDLEEMQNSKLIEFSKSHLNKKEQKIFLSRNFLTIQALSVSRRKIEKMLVE